MALPKEPRQKMINLMYLVLTALLALNVSSEVITAFLTINKSLENSKKNIEKANAGLFKALEAKANDPKIDKALYDYWSEKAKVVTAESDALNAYIESLKSSLITEAKGRNDKKGNFIYNYDDQNATTRLFIKEGKGEELKAKINEYLKKVRELDPSIDSTIGKSLPLNADDVVGQDGETKSFAIGNFNMTPAAAGVALLSKLQANVRNTQNQLENFCIQKIDKKDIKETDVIPVVYDEFAGLAQVDKSFVMEGEKITITAGVGAFNKKALPEISVEGYGNVPIGSEGVGNLTITAGAPGKYSRKVTMTYTTPRGKRETETTTIAWEVGKPADVNFGVTADDMNVFYAGVDNPITIAAPRSDGLSVTASGPISISGSGSKRNVTSNAASKSDCSITVSREGKSSTFPFRVLPLPNPVFKVGSGISPMRAGELAAQGFCRAELENFIKANVNFSIVSADAYFTGAGFPKAVGPVQISGNSLAPLSPQMSKLVPGSVVIFDNIKVKGPAGDIRTLKGAVTYRLI